MPWRGRDAWAVEPPSPVASDPGTGAIRLDRNENPYGPSPKVTEAMKDAVGAANRYPREEGGHRLAELIAAFHKVTPEQVILGCGSTEILRMAVCAFLGQSGQLLQALPTFTAIEHYARANGVEVISIPLTSDFAYDLDGMLGRARSSATLVYVCNPNNPTATLTPRQDLEKFILKLPKSAFVLIDEAYHHYAEPSGMYASFIDRPMDDERVIVTRSFSKIYGLAGLRLGYAIGSPVVVQQMQKFALEDNVNAIAARTAAAALDDADALRDAIQRNTNARQEFFNQAMARAMKPISSHTNFVMMNTFYPAEDVQQHFRQKNILLGRSLHAMDTYIRVSLGLPREMLSFWRAWDELPYPKHTMQH